VGMNRRFTAVVIVTPNPCEKGFVGNYLVFVIRQKDKNFKFFKGEGQFFVIPERLKGFTVQAEAAKTDLLLQRAAPP